jgi:monofunctional biosynthetic peptidoglycan transglycosylase
VAKHSLLRRWLWRLTLTATGALALLVLCVLSLRWIDPFSSAFMLEARLSHLGGLPPYRTDYRWVNLEAISPHAAIAVIASEDQQFPFHTGFDFKSIRQAVQNNARGKRQRGASTISQQVTKNLFLWQGGGYFRKALEAGITLLVEWLWPKERILEVYLNVAEFGRGIYGVEAAAQRYFHKPAKRLNRQEAALLAAVLPSPQRYKVEAPSRYVQSRQAWILGQMTGLGGTRYLDKLDQENAKPPVARK